MVVAALDLAEEMGVPRRVVRPVLRRQDLDGQRHREHGLGGPGAAPDHHLHPGAAARSTSSSPASTSAPSRTGTPRRPCCMHTKGILVMTPDSAMVLTGKLSLDYSGGVSAEDNFGIGGYDRVMGPERRGAVLGAEPHRRLRHPVRPLRPRLHRAGRTRPAARRRPPTRSTATCASYPHVHPDSAVHHGRRDLLRRDQQGPQEAVRHPDGDRRGRRPGPRRRSSAGPAWPTRTRRSSWTRTSAATRSTMHRHRVAADPAARLLAGRRSRPVDRRARCSRGRRKKTARAINAASGNRPLVVLANLSGFDGSPESLRKHPAGVRRRDRPGHRQLRRPDRLLRGLPLPRRRVRGVLRRAQRQHGGDRRRGLVRLGHRRRAGRGGRVHPRGQHPHRRRPAGQASWRTQSPRPTRRRAGPAAGRAGRAARPPSARRSSARWRTSSSRSTTSSGRWRSARSHTIIPAPRAAAVPHRGRRARPRARGQCEPCDLCDLWVGPLIFPIRPSPANKDD